MSVVPLTSPVAFNTFMRLHFEVTIPTSPDQRGQTNVDLCATITNVCKQAGCAVLVDYFPQTLPAKSLLVLYCQKAITARVFKTIVDWDRANQGQKGPQLTVAGIKQHASIMSSDPLQLQDMLSACLHKALVAAGWEHLHEDMFIKLVQEHSTAESKQPHEISSFLEAQVGSWSHVVHVRVSIQGNMPSGLLVVMADAGLSKFSPFNPLSRASGMDQSTQLRQALADPAGRRALVQQCYNRQCLLLPYMMSVVVKDVLLEAKDEDGLRQYWKDFAGYTLPSTIPCFFEVSASLDDEDEVHVVPSCCLWTASTAADNGFTPVSAQRPGTSPASIMNSVVQDFIHSSSGFWGEKPLAPASQSTTENAATTQAGPMFFQVTSGWVSAGALPPSGNEAVKSSLQQGRGSANPAQGVQGSALSSHTLNLTPACTGFSTARHLAVAMTQHHAEGDDDVAELEAMEEEEDVKGFATSKAPVRWQDIGREREAWKRLNPFFENLKAETKAMTAAQAIPERLLTKPVAQPRRAPKAKAEEIRPRAAAPGRAQSQAKQLLTPKFLPASAVNPDDPSSSDAVTKAKAEEVRPRAAAPARAQSQAKQLLTPKILPASTTNPDAPSSSDAVAGMLPATSSLPAASAAMGAEAADAAVPDPGAPAGNAVRKRSKAKDLDVHMVLEKVMEKHASGMLKSLTIPELQSFLRSRKQPVSGKKADLEARVVALLHAGKPAQA